MDETRKEYLTKIVKENDTYRINETLMKALNGWKEDKETVKFLLDLGIDPNKVVENWLPSYEGSYFQSGGPVIFYANSIEMFNLILSYGAKIVNNEIEWSNHKYYPMLPLISEEENAEVVINEYIKQGITFTDEEIKTMRYYTYTEVVTKFFLKNITNSDIIKNLDYNQIRYSFTFDFNIPTDFTISQDIDRYTCVQGQYNKLININ